MTREELLIQLEELAGRLNIQVQYESVKSEDPSTFGSYCRINDQHMVILHSKASTGRKIEIITDALNRFDIDDIVFNSYCNDGCIDALLPNLPPGVNLNCVNICNGYDSCMAELASQSKQAAVSFASFCSGVNNINNNTSPSDQFNADIQEAISVTACSIM